MWAEKQYFGENLTFLLVTVVLAKVRDFKMVVEWFSSVISGLDG